MKKLFFLLIIVSFILVIDGGLTYDFLEFKIDTLGEWLTFGLTLSIIIIVYWAEVSNNDES